MHESELVCVCVSGPRRAEQLQVVNITSSQVCVRWQVKAARHTTVSLLRVSVVPGDGSGGHSVLLNANATEHTFRSGAVPYVSTGCCC